MTRRSRSTRTESPAAAASARTATLAPLALIAVLLLVWQGVCSLGLVPAFMLPSPVSVLRAAWNDLPVLAGHAGVTLAEGFAGLFCGIAGAFALAWLMDRYEPLHHALYPILLLTQTVPTIAVAPLLILWMGYGPAPKITLVFLVCFFPVTVALFDGLRGADPDAVVLLRSMGASERQIFWQLKFPGALPRFFSGLKIAVTYAMVGAVIAEWLGGNRGLGVYMTRVRKSYSFDRMFAVIFLISALSILLLRLTMRLERVCTPWREREGRTGGPRKGSKEE